MVPRPKGDCDCIATEAAAIMHPATAAESLQTLRAFRDKVLARNERGKQLIAEYDLFTSRILLLFILEPSLRRLAAQFVQVIAPTVGTMLPRRANTGDVTKVTKQTIDIATRFGDALIAADRKHKNDCNLAQVVGARMAEIKQQELVGLTGRELQRVLGLTPNVKT